MIPARWSGRIPQQDFVCEPWPSLEEGLEVLPGLCAGGEPELMMCLANRAEVPVTIDPGASLASARLPEEGMVYHRLGPSLLTKRTGETILEHEGALMEVQDDAVKFLGSEVAFSVTNDRSEESSAERPPGRNADQQGGDRSETSPTAWTQVAGGRKRRFPAEPRGGRGLRAAILQRFPHPWIH